MYIYIYIYIYIYVYIYIYIYILIIQTVLEMFIKYCIKIITLKITPDIT